MKPTCITFSFQRNTSNRMLTLNPITNSNSGGLLRRNLPENNATGIDNNDEREVLIAGVFEMDNHVGSAV